MAETKFCGRVAKMSKAQLTWIAAQKVLAAADVQGSQMKAGGVDNENAM